MVGVSACRGQQLIEVATVTSTGCSRRSIGTVEMNASGSAGSPQTQGFRIVTALCSLSKFVDYVLHDNLALKGFVMCFLH